MSQVRVIGKIIGYHGLKGEIKVFPLLDNFSLLDEVKELSVSSKTYKLNSVRVNKANLLIKLESIDDRTAAEKLTGYISAKIEDDLEEDEFYIDDLMGLDAYDDSGKLLGQVVNFSDTGQILLHIKLQEDYQKKNELLVPFVKKYIQTVNLNSKQVVISAIKELLDLNN